VRTLTVLYDARCELCCRVRSWLQSQPKYVDLKFTAAASEEAYLRFPQLDHNRTLTELTVIDGNGWVYKGAKAWVMCLWALREYREWSLRLGTPELMPIARRVIVWVSRNRFKFSSHLRPTRLEI
jgi:predicted DCC family thiol-disulfide oxidoreductase YuxK